jgi:lipid II:glycine glycyltransferase (peptidoglycan interpeptide bridge formation enzyme)
MSSLPSNFGEDLFQDVDRDWDRFVAENRFGHHEQSSGHAITRRHFGFQCDQARIVRAGRIRAGAQVLSRATPVGRMAVVLRGPLAEDDDPALLSETIVELDRLAADQGYASLVVESFFPQEALRTALGRAGFHPDASWRGRFFAVRRAIDMTDEEILGSMEEKGRYNTRLAIRRGVEVSVVGGEGVADFYALHQMTAEHQRFPVFPVAYFEYLWNLFVPMGRMQLFVATAQGKPVGAIYNTIVGDHMLYGWGGMHRGDAERKSMANYLLQFRAMQWAREHGCRYYDLGSISGNSHGGVTQFKTRLASDKVYWPTPMRKWYGPAGGLRDRLSRSAWSSRLLRRNVERVAWMAGLKQKLPW